MELAERIKVIVCDDHILFREGIKASLSFYKDLDIIAEAGDGTKLMQLLKYMTPDVILLDINMPIMDGIEVLPKLKSEYPDIKVVIVSMHNNASMISKMIALGANSYLTKGDLPETIYQSIKGVYTENVYFTPLMNKAMLKATQENVTLKTMDIRSELKKEEVQKPDYGNSEILERIVRKLDEIDQRTSVEDNKVQIQTEEPNDDTGFSWANLIKKVVASILLSALVIIVIWGIVKWRTESATKTAWHNKIEINGNEIGKASRPTGEMGSRLFGW
jgi:DNA-binding NarL/FixJ family response regulator